MKVGDKVKVIGVNDSDDIWVPSMDETIGKFYLIYNIRDNDEFELNSGYIYHKSSLMPDRKDKIKKLLE